MEIQLNDVVQIDTTADDLCFVGMIGFVTGLSNQTVSVTFFYMGKPDEAPNHYEHMFMRSQVLYIGKPILTPA
jgi:hypothetical protein